SGQSVISAHRRPGASLCSPGRGMSSDLLQLAPPPGRGCQQLTVLGKSRYPVCMEMTSLNISLPSELKEFIEEKVASGGYGTASEYVRELIREARKVAAQAKLETLLLAAVEQLDRGEGIEMTPKFWEDLCRDLKQRLAKKTAA